MLEHEWNYLNYIEVQTEDKVNVRNANIMKYQMCVMLTSNHFHSLRVSQQS